MNWKVSVLAMLTVPLPLPDASSSKPPSIPGEPSPGAIVFDPWMN